jgi:cytochrome c-type biogenesis protein CcmF
LPGADWGKATAHIGMGVMVFGVAAITAWQQEDIRIAQVDVGYDVGNYTFTLRDVAQVEGPNYLSTFGTIDVARGEDFVTTLRPEKRFYPVAQMPTTEAAIRNGILRDIYVVIGDAQADGGHTVRVYIKPFANWIWGGAMLMALGGLLSLLDRRLRVAAGAPKPAKPASVT